MINPSEQEGEVDHSFFDSDCDNGSLSSSTSKITEKGLKADKKASQQAREKPRAKPTAISRDGLSQKSIGRRKQSEERDDTVTDVTTLSTPDCSPLQSLDFNHTETEEESVRQQQQHRSVPSSGLSKVHQAKDLGRNVDERKYPFTAYNILAKRSVLSVVVFSILFFYVKVKLHLCVVPPVQPTS